MNFYFYNPFQYNEMNDKKKNAYFALLNIGTRKEKYLNPALEWNR